MHNLDDHEHHRERVRAELNLALDAVHVAAMQAHMELAVLHMRRLEEPQRAGGTPFGRESGIGSPALIAATLYA